MSLNKEVGLDDVMQIIAEKLETGGSVTFNPKGTSMLPMLRDGCFIKTEGQTSSF